MNNYQNSLFTEQNKHLLSESSTMMTKYGWDCAHTERQQVEILLTTDWTVRPNEKKMNIVGAFENNFPKLGCAHLLISFENIFLQQYTGRFSLLTGEFSLIKKKHFADLIQKNEFWWRQIFKNELFLGHTEKQREGCVSALGVCY